MIRSTARVAENSGMPISAKAAIVRRNGSVGSSLLPAEIADELAKIGIVLREEGKVLLGVEHHIVRAEVRTAAARQSAST